MKVQSYQGRRVLRRIFCGLAEQGSRPLRRWAACCCLLVGCALIGTHSTARGALVMYIADASLLSNQPDQEILAFIENGFDFPIDVLGIQFNVQVDDGEGLVSAPKITRVDILSDTVFENDSSGLGGGQDTEWRWELSTLENSIDPLPILPPKSILTAATITLDTTGISPSTTYTLSLSTPAGPTTYLDPDPDGESIPSMTLSGATLTVMPEPSVVALLLFTWIGLALPRRRPS